MNPADYHYNFGQLPPDYMDVNFLIETLNQIGIPVGISIILMWFIKYQFDSSRKERDEARQDRISFEGKIVESLNEVKLVINTNNELFREFLRGKA